MCDAGEGGAILITGSAFVDVLVEENDNLVPFHCGSYEFSNSNMEPTEEQLVLLEPAALADRVHHFPRTLKKGHKLSDHALNAPRGDVTLAFTYFPATEALLAWDQGLAAEVLEHSNAVYRDALRDFGGYEVESSE